MDQRLKCKLLLEHANDKNPGDMDGKTPLHFNGEDSGIICPAQDFVAIVVSLGGEHEETLITRLYRYF
jgi:hypothetical protein